MRRFLLATAALAGLSAVVAAPASADTITVYGAATNPPPFAVGNFGNAGTNGFVSNAPIALTNGLVTFAPDASSPQAGVYDGNQANVAASPFTGTALTPANYLVAEPSDPVNITFTSLQSSFSLLWGSVDSYNSLTLELYAGPILLGSETVTGGAVTTASGNTIPDNGSTSAYVTITPSVYFDRVQLFSSTSAFEFDPSVKVASTSVPEPASLALLGAGLCGIGFFRRKTSG